MSQVPESMSINQHPARGGDIVGAVQHLESIFLKAECDLNYVSRKLDTEFETVFAEHGQENINPVRIVQRIEKAKREIEKLKLACLGLQHDRQEFLSAALPALLANGKNIRGLSKRVSLSCDAPSEEVLLESLCVKPAAAETEADGLNSTFSIEPTGTETKPPPPAQRTRNAFMPVTEVEFNSVSELVRGRVKLSEVNQAFECIFNAFKKDKKRFFIVDATEDQE